MDTQLILGFLKRIAANNSRPWFQEHREEYEAARENFERGVALAIARITEFDPSVAHVTVRDATYRFYRDIRFSPDKAPYKRHFGAYIAAQGKKSHHGGYYIHLEPGQCLLACGDYCLPTQILTACRNEIIGNEDEWLRCVQSEEFLRWFGAPAAAKWEDPQGFGFEKLKTCPAGFPRDYKYIDYLRLKDYCCWHRVQDNFFEGDGWLEDMEKIFKAGKPVCDFINSVVDDYE